MPAWGQRCPTRRRLILLAVLVYALALAVRSVVYYEARNWPTFTHPQIDEFTAHQIGLAFLDGRTPPEVYLKGPLYMYFVAGVAWLFGREPQQVRIVQIVLSSLTPMLIFLTTERLFGWRIGLLAGVIGAVFWTIVYYSLAIVDAALSSLLYVLLIYLLVALDNGRRWKWPVCGAVMGLGALSRPSVLAFAPVLAVMVLVVTWRRVGAGAGEVLGKRRPFVGLPRALHNVVTLTAGCLAVILPVTIRNYVVAGEWVLIGAYGGQNLWIANSPRSDGKNVPIYVDDDVPKVTPVEQDDVWTQISLGNRIARYYAEKEAGRRLKFGEIDAYFARIAMDYIRSHPGAFLAKSLKRFCFFLNAYEYPNERDIYRFLETSRLLKVLSYVHFGILCPVALIGLAFVVARRAWTAELAYLVGMLTMLWFPGLFFVVNARFRVVVVCLMVPFAAYGLTCLAGLFRHATSWSTRVATTIALAGLLVVSNTNLFGYREKHYTDHRMGFAVACVHANRQDLIPAAVDRFAEALDEDLASGRLTQTAIMEHAHPLGWVFSYYYFNGKFDRALRYGELMMQREPPDGQRVANFFDLAIRMNQEQDAAEALDVLTKGRMTIHPMEIVMRLIRFGQRYGDASRLIQAERLLQQMVEAQPAELSYHRALAHVRSLLKHQASPATATVGAASQPGRKE